MIVGDVVVADWFFYGVVAVFGFAFFAVVYWFYSVRLKKEFRAVFTSKASGVREWMGEKSVSKKDLVVGETRYWGKPYTVDMKKPYIRKFNKTYQCIDMDEEKGDILTFDGNYKVTSPADRNKYINAGLWNRIMSLVGGRKADLLLVVVLMGVLAGVTFGVGVFASPYLLKPSNMTVVTKLVGVFV